MSLTFILTMVAFLVVGAVIWVAGMFLTNGETETEE